MSIKVGGRGGSDAWWKKNILNFHFDYWNPSPECRLSSLWTSTSRILSALSEKEAAEAKVVTSQMWICGPQIWLVEIGWDRWRLNLIGRRRALSSSQAAGLRFA